MSCQKRRRMSEKYSRTEASIPTQVLKEGEDDSSLATTAKIRLTLQEESLISTILNAIDYLQKGKIDGYAARPVVVRIAGGWVRDKLLNRSTHDVDIVIDCLSGVDFAKILQAYLKLTVPNEVKRIGVIAANPNQSKHLETATMVVKGIECDFCNLRAEEVYSDTSRIPTTRFGTPLEDSQRRDFTINSLFFNLQTQLIEDWTGQGLTDLLESKLLVTPLDPFTTFQDDPLRVLRAIRFSIRFNFNLDKNLMIAMSSKQIHDALVVKVSRERVGKELEGCLSGKGAKPTKALRLIGDLHLSRSVFLLPSIGKIEGELLEQTYVTENQSDAWEISKLSMKSVELVDSVHVADSQVKCLLDTRLLALTAYLLPFRKLSYVGQKLKQLSIVEFMIREGIKFKNKDVRAIMLLIENVDKFRALSKNDEQSRETIGMLLRTTKDLWVTCLFLAGILESAIESAQDLYIMIARMKLDMSWKNPPLLDGRIMIQALGLPKGPLVGTFMEAQVRWTLNNPEGTKDQVLEHLKQYQQKLESK
mmetsp:Transcript_34693/g.39538  ORF Transcript_34693/g.39538 Transcript_34693/m.39538 type:complete len:533 (-) Transcript_34693:214-1812(-)